MTSEQLTDLEARLTERGYKKWTKCLVGREDYAWHKKFGVHDDTDGDETCDYLMAFRIYDHRNRHPNFTPTEESEIGLTVTMIPNATNNRLDCDYSLHLDVPDIEMCEKMMAEIFETTEKYKL